MSATLQPRTDLARRDRTDRAAEPSAEGRVGRERPRQQAGLMLALILAAFIGRCVWIATTDSITSDESTHLVHCLHFWMTGDDLGMWRLGAPRLPHALGALASYVAVWSGGLFPSTVDGPLEAGLTRLVLSGADRVLVPARLVAIGWGALLLLAVFWAVTRQHGTRAGLAAVGILALVPEVVAHASIAGSDIPFTAAAFLTLVLKTRYAESPSRGRWIALALGIGLAWAMRHTALLLLAMAGVVHLVVAWREVRPRSVWAAVELGLGSLTAWTGLTLLAGMVLWAGDGFGTLTVAEVAAQVTTMPIPRSLGGLDLSGLPVPTSLLSILKQIRHQNGGHEAYFLGQFGTMGWPLYFPVAFLLKTPIGLLALMVLAAARVRPRGAWDAVSLGFLALLWLMLVRNKVDIGLRYALLTYPIAVTFVARLFDRPLWDDRIGRAMAVGSALGLAVASLGCGTRCLSYFNEIGGGSQQGWLYLADSNVDWGQDFDALRQRIAELGLTEVTTDISSERRMTLPGVLIIANPGKAQQVPDVTPPNRRLYDSDGGYIPVYTRYVAVSVSRFLGLYSQNDMSWLRTRKLVARVGDSTFLFDMDRPADKPLW